MFTKNKYLETSDLYRVAFYCYIITKGSDLERIRIDPDIDEENTISNHIMEIYDVLGIEVVRNYLEKKYLICSLSIINISLLGILG